MRCWVLLLVASAITCAAHASSGHAYAAFLDAFTRNDVRELKAIAVTCGHGTEAERQVGLLAIAGARFRSEDMRGCVQALDSLGSMRPTLHRQVAAMACQLRAQVFDWAGDHEAGLRQVALGLELADSIHAAQERTTLLIIGAEIMLSQGDLTNAAGQLVIAERLAHRIGFIRGVAMVAINRGTIHFYQQRYEEAVQDFKMTSHLAVENNWPVLLENASFNLASALIMLGRPGDALNIFNELTLRKELPPVLHAQLLSHIGRTWADMGRPQEAISAFDRSIAISDSLGDQREALKARQQHALAAWALGLREQAIAQLTGLRQDARTQLMGPTLAELHWQLHDWWKQMGHSETSLLELESFAAIRDSLNKKAFNDQIARSEVVAETERKERRIAEQDQALELADEQDSRKSLQRNIAIGSALALVALVALLWRSLRTRRKLAEKEQELHAKRVDALMHEQETRSINAMLEGQEKERDRLAKDLHDRLGGMLSAIKHQLGAVEEDVHQVRSEQSAQYIKVHGMLDEAVGEVRRISHDMITITLSRFGLAKALDDLCDTVRVTGRMDVELRTFGLEQRMERSREIAVYRIVQEAISNVLKHAQATEMSVDVTRGPGRLSVIIHDNGKGFDTGMHSSGIGLENMRQRAAGIGATLRLESTPGKGTSVSLEGAVVE